MSQPTDTQQQEVLGGAVRITAAAPAEQVRVVLFYIDDADGNTVAYTVPKRIPANLGLQFLEVAAVNTPGVAEVWLMEMMIGDEGMTELRGAEGMADDQLQALRDRFHELYLPQLDELLSPKDSKKRSRNSRGS